jgi:chromosome segregation ATPase
MSTMTQRVEELRAEVKELEEKKEQLRQLISADELRAKDNKTLADEQESILCSLRESAISMRETLQNIQDLIVENKSTKEKKQEELRKVEEQVSLIKQQYEEMLQTKQQLEDECEKVRFSKEELFSEYNTTLQVLNTTRKDLEEAETKIGVVEIQMRTANESVTSFAEELEIMTKAT